MLDWNILCRPSRKCKRFDGLAGRFWNDIVVMKVDCSGKDKFCMCVGFFGFYGAFAGLFVCRACVVIGNAREKNIFSGRKKIGMRKIIDLEKL